MRLSHIALKNVRIHPSRTGLLVVVIAATVAVVATLLLVSRSAQQDLADKVDSYGANIVVLPRTRDLPLTYGGVRVGALVYESQSLHMDDLAKIRGIPDAKSINVVAPKLLETAEIGGVRVLVVGVQWEQELEMKTWWSLSGARPAGPHDVLLGSKAADHLGLSPGDRTKLKGEEFRVSGRLQPTGTTDDEVVFLELATVQRLWDRPEELSMTEISAWCSSCPLEAINAQISSAMPNARVSALSKAAKSREILVDQFRLFASVLSGFMILVGSLIVLTSTLARVRERRREIGILRAVGYRRHHVFTIVLLENLALAVGGGILGMVIASVVAGPIARLVAGVGTTVPPSLGDLALGIAGSVAMVLLASLYPAFRSTRVSPGVVMQQVY